ncbi:FAD/NAD-binding domain-containing protein [Pleurotus eryngii]|uniref:Kynurenine 3-monooxygenase n=1 Tax=Pleurotus eryngii TaxID=5323 RepID=A0A9P6ABD9_PLEER|nr:FAD/NAD-binding domain-containing protein [Pleurotus eryngii]
MNTAHPAHQRTAVVVGAGPVGCLAAIALAHRGWQVRLYEGRSDMRLPTSKAVSQQRSINLAISSRGILALQAISPSTAQRLLQTVIPMKGRMIHHINGKQESQLYDKDGQCINSIDRALLNEELLQEAANTKNIRILFNHKVQNVDFEKKTIGCRNVRTGEDASSAFDLIIGADGSYSVVRRQMMRVVRMNYQQEYIRDEYKELKMQPGQDKDGNPTFLIDPNHLHIWPRHSFMLIALPNQDKTFTCTLFAPSAEFDHLQTPKTILAWFKLNFPDALSLIGEDTLVKDFQRNPRCPLICTKSRPYHYKDCAILLGDAAHSMVPFYGQGLNCGLEDVRVLDALFHEEGVSSTEPPAHLSTNGSDEKLYRVLDRYSENRHEDLIAICDLAMDNYAEMRHSVVTPMYTLKKILDTFFYKLSARKPFSLTALGPYLSRTPFPPGEPTGWIPLYTMVTFRPDISYATARTKAAYQSRILTYVGWTGTTIFALGGAYLAAFLMQSARSW